MGQPVVHFEIIGADGPALHRYYAGLFGWEINVDNPMNYGIVTREGNTNASGSAAASRATRACPASSRSTSRYPTSRPR